jgi:long-chain acyl-CoA synthetase
LVALSAIHRAASKIVRDVLSEITDTRLECQQAHHIARFKRPKDYVFVDALPKNNYGKILKTELRALDAKRKAS